MYCLYQRGDSHGFIIEASQENEIENFPRYYSGRWDEMYLVNQSHSAAQLKEQLKNEAVQPNYVVFLSDQDLDNRVAHFKEVWPGITEVKVASPSYIDKVFHWLNPLNNKNEACFVYLIGNP